MISGRCETVVIKTVIAMERKVGIANSETSSDVYGTLILSKSANVVLVPVWQA